MNIIARNSVLAIALIITFACGIPVSHADPFYSAWDQWGAARFPLIKPYEVIYFEEVGGWTMDLDLGLHQPSNEMTSYLDIKEVEKISVHDGAIMIYSEYKRQDLRPDEYPLFWFVIIPGKTEDSSDDVVRGFENESEFLNFIKGYEIGDITWESPDEINSTFVWTGCLEWIPDCN
jgi:hypothetical protein